MKTKNKIYSVRSMSLEQTGGWDRKGATSTMGESIQQSGKGDAERW